MVAVENLMRNGENVWNACGAYYKLHEDKAIVLVGLKGASDHIGRSHKKVP